jgi:hypothetical protein
MTRVRQYGWVVFVAFAVLGTVFGVFPGGWFEEGVDRDAMLLTSTYGLVAVVLTIAIAVTAFRRGEMWAWSAFWVWPVFFVVHGVAFFAFDFVFAAIGAFTLAATYPGTSPAQERRTPEAAVAGSAE